MSEQITIVVEPKLMRVVDGRVKGARLWYQAPGLDIYCTGEVRANRIHAVSYLAVENAVARHIPAMSVRSVREPRKPKTQPKSPRQRSMF